MPGTYPGMIKAEEYSLLGCTGQIKEVGLWIWLVFLSDTMLFVPKKWFALGGAISPWPESFFFKMSKHHNNKNKHTRNKQQNHDEWFWLRWGQKEVGVGGMWLKVTQTMKLSAHNEKDGDCLLRRSVFSSEALCFLFNF